MRGLTGLVAGVAMLGLAGAAQAQGYPPQGGPNQGYARQPNGEGFGFRGDELPGPSHDQGYYRHYDPRYSETYRQQMAEPARPRGGCLKYGAVGAAGGYAVGHPVLGALAGCVTGRVVRDRDRDRIDQQYGR